MVCGISVQSFVNIFPVLICERSNLHAFRSGAEFAFLEMHPRQGQEGDLCTVTMKFPRVTKDIDIGFGVLFGASVPTFEEDMETNLETVRIHFRIPPKEDAFGGMQPASSRVEVMALFKRGENTFQSARRHEFCYLDADPGPFQGFPGAPPGTFMPQMGGPGHLSSLLAMPSANFAGFQSAPFAQYATHPHASGLPYNPSGANVSDAIALAQLARQSGPAASSMYGHPIPPVPASHPAAALLELSASASHILQAGQHRLDGSELPGP
eukprot:m.576963 g.576963  ORF g.576963 m.576963 type:complete len:267 (+) comp57903_c0_seq10:1510-2310(+)